MADHSDTEEDALRLLQRLKHELSIGSFLVCPYLPEGRRSREELNAKQRHLEEEKRKLEGRKEALLKKLSQVKEEISAVEARLADQQEQAFKRYGFRIADHISHSTLSEQRQSLELQANDILEQNSQRVRDLDKSKQDEVRRLLAEGLAFFFKVARAKSDEYLHGVSHDLEEILQSTLGLQKLHLTKDSPVFLDLLSHIARRDYEQDAPRQFREATEKSLPFEVLQCVCRGQDESRWIFDKIKAIFSSEQSHLNENAWLDLKQNLETFSIHCCRFHWNCLLFLGQGRHPLALGTIPNISSTKAVQLRKHEL